MVTEDYQHCILEVAPALEGLDCGGERFVHQRGHVEAIMRQTGGPDKGKVPLKSEAAGERLRVVEEERHL